MTTVPISSEQIFVDVLNDTNLIQVQSYPISELQSILGAQFQPQTIVIQPQIGVSEPQSIVSGTGSHSIILQTQAQSIVSHSQPEVPLTQEQPQLQSQTQTPAPVPYLEELKAIEVKLEDTQDNSQPIKTAKKNKNQGKPFKCTFNSTCRFSCDSEDRLVRHIRMHRGENAYQCDYCVYSTYHSAAYSEHVNIHKGIKPFKCSFCPYRSASKQNRKKHEIIHSPSNPRRCDQCNFVARQSSGLVKHKKNVHGTKTVEVKETKPDLNKATDDIEENNDCESKLYCKHCKVTLKSEKAFNYHLKVHRKCYLCGDYFRSIELLNKHHLQMHDGYQRVKKAPEFVPSFQCAHCEWSSSNKPKILLHLIHHPNQTVSPSVVNISILRKYGIMS